MLVDPLDILVRRNLGSLAGELRVDDRRLGAFDRDSLVEHLVLSAAESSSQTTSPFFTLVPSGLSEMIEFVPSTRQKASLFREDSRTPWATSFTMSFPGLTACIGPPSARRP